jgi:hypothetical protein
MKNHKWSKEQREILLETLYRKYKHIDESYIFELISDRIGCEVNSVKGLYKSFQRISKGIKPNTIKGGPGYNWIEETLDVYNEFMERNNISEKEQQTMFS